MKGFSWWGIGLPMPRVHFSARELVIPHRCCVPPHPTTARRARARERARAEAWRGAREVRDEDRFGSSLKLSCMQQRNLKENGTDDQGIGLSSATSADEGLPQNIPCGPCFRGGSCLLLSQPPQATSCLLQEHRFSVRTEVLAAFAYKMNRMTRQ